VRQHRKTILLARTAVMTLALLTCLTGVGAYLAFQQRNEAQAQRQVADEQRSTAEARATHIQQQLAKFYVEQGRQALIAEHPMQAAVYLSTAYQLGEVGPILRLLLAQAMPPIDAQRLSVESTDLAGGPAAFSPDGTRIVLVSADHTAHMWDTAHWRRLSAFSGHTNVIQSVQFSADGTRLITGSHDGTAKVWEVATGHLLYSLDNHPSPVEAAFSRDSTRIVTTVHDTQRARLVAQVWNAATGHLLSSTPIDVARGPRP